MHHEVAARLRHKCPSICTNASAMLNAGFGIDSASQSRRVTVQGVEDGDPKVTLDNSPIAKYVGVDEWAARQATEAAWERRFRTDEPMEP